MHTLDQGDVLVGGAPQVETCGGQGVRPIVFGMAACTPRRGRHIVRILAILKLLQECGRPRARSRRHWLGELGVEYVLIGNERGR